MVRFALALALVDPARRGSIAAANAL